MSVNGVGVPVTAGVGKFSAGASGPGIKKYTANVTLVNPVTKQPSVYTGQFEYEVGLRSATVSADQMNVFYVGVANPITVSASGISSNKLKVGVSNGRLESKGNGKYEVFVSNIGGTATITLSGEGLPASSFPFRIKRIPSPVAYIANSMGGAIGDGTLKVQRAIEPRLENFDFNAKCTIQGFVMRYIARRQDPLIVTNAGGSFGGEAAGLLAKAKPGDTYAFDNIKAKCPGDAAGRTINSISFNVR